MIALEKEISCTKADTFIDANNEFIEQLKAIKFHFIDTMPVKYYCLTIVKGMQNNIVFLFFFYFYFIFKGKHFKKLWRQFGTKIKKIL